MERLKSMKEMLMACAQSQISGNLSNVDAKELGEVIDMIKDLEETLYYCTVVEAMEKNKEKKYYREIWDDERMYYTPSKSSNRNNSMTYNDNDDTRKGYVERTPHYPKEIRDVREGRSPMARRSYMEGKEIHKDKNLQMQELDKYMHELAEDLTEMISDASPEEKTLLQEKLKTLATKVK